MAGETTTSIVAQFRVTNSHLEESIVLRILAGESEEQIRKALRQSLAME